MASVVTERAMEPASTRKNLYHTSRAQSEKPQALGIQALRQNLGTLTSVVCTTALPRREARPSLLAVTQQLSNMDLTSSQTATSLSPSTGALSLMSAPADNVVQVSASGGKRPQRKSVQQLSPFTFATHPPCEAAEKVVEKVNDLHRMARSVPDTPAATSNDIFISYRRSDATIMTKLKDVLQRNGFSVWVDESCIDIGANFIGKIGEGICNSKIFMCIVTEATYSSRYCTDELCLAYIKEKPIYAVSLLSQENMFRIIPTAIKLLVSRFEWTMVSEENLQGDVESQLVSKLKNELQAQLKHQTHSDGYGQLKFEASDDLSPLQALPGPSTVSSADGHKHSLKKTHSRNRLYKRMNSRVSRCLSVLESPDCVPADYFTDFWTKHFADLESTTWQRFEKAFFDDYEEQLRGMYEPSEKEWFMTILKRELGADSGVLQRSKYKDFITDDEGTELCVFSCVTDLCRENIAMRSVFSLDSSVRIDAINNLAKFHSQAVVEALLDMLNDPEQDVRATACLSLAKVSGGFESMKINRLRYCLKDEDRFVRQAACAALGHLNADIATNDLLKIWRNDHIAEVRLEAESALKAIGGDVVLSSINATKMLVKEMSELNIQLRSSKNSYLQYKAQYEKDHCGGSNSSARRVRL